MPYLRPDGKTQVTVEFEGDRPVRVDKVVISSQHDPDVTMDKLRADMIMNVVLPIVPENYWIKILNIISTPPAALWSAAHREIVA